MACTEVGLARFYKWTINFPDSVMPVVIGLGNLLTMQNLPTEPSDRFATRAAHDRLDGLFAFPHDPYRQDWEIELSDGSRLEEFFIAYESQELTEDERFALMALVVASAHDALDFHNLTDGQWQIVHELLVRDSHIHTFTHRLYTTCLLYTSPSPRDRTRYRMPSSA